MMLLMRVKVRVRAIMRVRVRVGIRVRVGVRIVPGRVELGDDVERLGHAAVVVLPDRRDLLAHHSGGRLHVGVAHEDHLVIDAQHAERDAHAHAEGAVVVDVELREGGHRRLRGPRHHPARCGSQHIRGAARAQGQKSKGTQHLVGKSGGDERGDLLYPRERQPASTT